MSLDQYLTTNLKEIRETAVRPFLKGLFSLDSSQEFDNRFKKGWSDRFEKTQIDINKYLASLS